MRYHPFRTLLLTALRAAGFSSCIRTDIGSIGKEFVEPLGVERNIDTTRR